LSSGTLNPASQLNRFQPLLTDEIDALCLLYPPTNWLRQPQEYENSPPSMLEYEIYILQWSFQDSVGAVFPFYNVDEDDYFYAQVVASFSLVEHKKGVFPWSPYSSKFDLICRGKKIIFLRDKFMFKIQQKIFRIILGAQ